MEQYIPKSAVVAEIERLVNNYDKALDYEAALEDVRNFLDTLKGRCTWKPCEQDILLLERIANGKSNPQDFQASLGALIGQLKKLMEE